MKILPFVLLSFLAAGCASNQQREEEVIQKDEEIQMQEEEMNRTGASDESYVDPASSAAPYPVN